MSEYHKRGNLPRSSLVYLKGRKSNVLNKEDRQHKLGNFAKFGFALKLVSLRLIVAASNTVAFTFSPVCSIFCSGCYLNKWSYIEMRRHYNNYFHRPQSGRLKRPLRLTVYISQQVIEMCFSSNKSISCSPVQDCPPVLHLYGVKK